MNVPSKLRNVLLTLPLLAAASPLPAKEPAVYTRNVAIVLYEGVELLDFAGPGEVFGAAARFGSSKGAPAFNVYTVAVTKDPLKSYFVKIQPEYAIDDAPKPDVIVIPGGNTDHLLENAKFMAWLKAAQPKTEVTLTVCTGGRIITRAVSGGCYGNQRKKSHGQRAVAPGDSRCGQEPFCK